MFQKKASRTPASDKLLASWQPSKKPERKIDWGIDAGTAIIYIVMLIIVPLLALTITFYNQRNERIDCGSLTKNSIGFLEATGEELPASCFAH